MLNQKDNKQITYIVGGKYKVEFTRLDSGMIQCVIRKKKKDEFVIVEGVDIFNRNLIWNMYEDFKKGYYTEHKKVKILR